MAFTVNLYTLAKKKNSTEVPASVAVSFTNCMIKEGCGIVNPTIGIDNGLTWNPSVYNYAGIPSFNRFYYITDWYFDRGRWWANMAVDVLATYKTAILNSTAYIARASKTYDGDIADNMFPAKSTSTGYRSYWPNNDDTPWKSDFDDGFYVVGIMNNDSSSIGAVSYYAFSPNEFATLKGFLMGNTTWTGILDTNPDFGDNLYKSLFNPFQYISSVMWIPLAWNADWGTAISTLKFGWWTINNMYCSRITQYLYEFTARLLAGEHPQAPARGKYLCGSPFTTYRLIAPPFGEFVLDSALILNSVFQQYDGARAATVSVKILVDFITGLGDLYVSCNIDGEGITLLHTQTTIAVPIQIAQINNNAWGQIRNAVDTVANVVQNAASLNIGGVISNTATGILNGFEMKIPHVQEHGSNGSIGIYTIPFVLDNVFAIMADDAPADKGRPLCKEDRIGNQSPGYVQTVGAHVEIAGTETEIEQINGYLDGGVYLE